MYFVNVGTCSEIHLSVVPAKLSPNAALKLELTLSTYILIFSRKVKYVKIHQLLHKVQLNPIQIINL
jgi:hypothetical protein